MLSFCKITVAQEVGNEASVYEITLCEFHLPWAKERSEFRFSTAIKYSKFASALYYSFLKNIFVV